MSATGAKATCMAGILFANDTQDDWPVAAL